MMLAVLEESFARFAALMEDIPLAGTPLVERTALFVDRAWEHFSGRFYRSTFEILLNYLGREDLGERDWRRQMWLALDAVWTRIFADSRLPRARSRMLQHFTVSTLAGLASTLMLEGEHATLPRKELDLLKETLTRELAGG
jgi:hypothetical protein